MMKRCPVCTKEYSATQRTCPEHGAVLVETRELAPGTVIRERYRIVRVLRLGGMGIDYLAEHLFLNRRLVLKFLAWELASQEEAVQRFMREALRARTVEDANVVQIFDGGQSEDGSSYICTEYVDGPSLADLLDDWPKGLPVERAFAIARGIAHGLAAVHAKGMVHGDIKPESVIVGRDRQGQDIAKIAVLGIASGSEDEGGRERKRVMVAPVYSPPEQWRGLIPKRELDGRTDLYALGCVFFEMLTGSVPFRWESLEELIKQHLSAERPLVSALRPELGKFPGLDDLVKQLMAKDREDRLASAQDFLHALDGTQADTMVRRKNVDEAEASAAATLVSTASKEQPAAVRVATRPLDDYNLARSLSTSERSEFLSRLYPKHQTVRWVNPLALRGGSYTRLRFIEDESGKFLAILNRSGDLAYLFPELSVDYELSRKMLEGVYVYPDGGEHSLELIDPARIELDGDVWKLRGQGKFAAKTKQETEP